jgi:tetratricopeptide (TPR) repeat protein
MQPDTENPQTCPHCGNLLAPNSAACPNCGRRISRFHASRETVLGISIALIVIFFFVTRSVAKAYHLKLNALAQQWFQSGQRQLQSGNAAQALVDFRTALVYAPDDPRIQFPLAEALAASGRDAEARAYLLGLLQQSPSNAPVNLALARISARAGSESEALRYYHGAIYGVWPQDPLAERLQTRFELCQFLLGRNDKSSVDTELLALASEIPLNNAEMLARAGTMFLDAGDATHALDEFRKALSARPSLLIALRGAGLTAFQLDHYRQAEKYLSEARRISRNDAEIASALTMTRLVLSADPSLPGLTFQDRRQRVRADFHQAFLHLQACMKNLGIAGSSASAPQPDVASLFTKAKAFRLRLSDRYLRRPEDLNAALDFTFEMENLCAQKCGPSAGFDAALLRLEKSRRSSQP